MDTVIEALVWAHLFGPAEARKVATDYFVGNGRRIQVGYADPSCLVPSAVCIHAV